MINLDPSTNYSPPTSSDMLKNNIRKLKPEENDLNFTLREFISKCLLNCPNNTYLISLLNIINFPNFQLTKYNMYLGLIFEKNSPLKISFQLIAQLGEKLLDQPLHKILSENPPYCTEETKILQSIHLYQSIYKANRRSAQWGANMVGIFHQLCSSLFPEEDPEAQPIHNAFNCAKKTFENIEKNYAIIHSVLDSTTFTISENSAVNSFNFLKAKHIYNIFSKSIKNMQETWKSDWNRSIKNLLPTVTPDVPESDDFFKLLEGKINALFDQYDALTGKKTAAEIHQAYSEYLFKDEFLTEVKRCLPKKHFPSTTNQTSPEPKEKKEKLVEEISFPSPELTLQGYLSDHHRQIYELSIKIKESLSETKMHSKELRDHLNFVSLNFHLFCQAIEDHDFYALGAIIPFFCMDLFLVNEQLFKSQLAAEGKPWIKSHNLSHLRKAQGDATLEAFFLDFNDALLQSRYPVEKSASLKKTLLPGPLKWILFSQQTDTMSKKDLNSLCDFVLNSYSQTLKHLSYELNEESLDCTFAKPFLEKALSTPIKKSAPSSLSIQQKLLEKEGSILKACAKEDQIAAKQTLEEISHYLIQINAVNHLQERYPDVKFGALHQRNCMMFQWPLEKLYALKGIQEGMGDLRYLSEDHSSANHDLTVFHAFTLSTKEIPPALKEFNLGRKFHYHRENSPLLENLTFARKNLKKLDPCDPNWTLANKGKIPEKFAETLVNNRKETFNKGIDLLEKTLLIITDLR